MLNRELTKRETAMPQKERMRVWKGELKKTSGGLTKNDLIKNKRGKIVSKKKSNHAVGDENNLGSWLRGKGDKFQGKPKGYKKDAEDEKDDEKLAEVPQKKPKLRLKLKPPPPKKRPPPPKKARPVVVDLTDSPVKAKKPAAPAKAQRPKKTRNVPMVAGEKKEYGKISVGNIYGAADKKKALSDSMKAYRKILEKRGLSKAEIDKMLSGGGSSIAAKVRKLLKASKRRGKRRTKKQLLQDVLDL
jgi:hypothetical protein